mmetsp:Transcript_6354/g.17236  ORF Transcript_6354/g.17236 Transcript_6354/m.17236 type:complete len:322 (-) Transcript_6354:24-989(-)
MPTWPPAPGAPKPTGMGIMAGTAPPPAPSIPAGMPMLPGPTATFCRHSAMALKRMASAMWVLAACSICGPDICCSMAAATAACDAASCPCCGMPAAMLAAASGGCCARWAAVAPPRRPWGGPSCPPRGSCAFGRAAAPGAPLPASSLAIFGLPMVPEKPGTTRSSSLLCAYRQSSLSQRPVLMSERHSFVRNKSGKFARCSLSWANWHASPRVQQPRMKNLHILVFSKTFVRAVPPASPSCADREALAAPPSSSYSGGPPPPRSLSPRRRPLRGISQERHAGHRSADGQGCHRGAGKASRGRAAARSHPCPAPPRGGGPCP